MNLHALSGVAERQKGCGEQKEQMIMNINVQKELIKTS